MKNTPRLAAFASAAVISIAVALGVSALRGAGPAVRARSCEVTWSVSLGGEVTELPHALASHHGETWAALARSAGGATQLRLVRARDGRMHQEVFTARADHPEAVSRWALDARGIHLAVASAREARVITPHGAERVIALPGERRAPALAATATPEGITLLAQRADGRGSRVITPRGEGDWTETLGVPNALSRSAMRVTLDTVSLAGGALGYATTLSASPETSAESAGCAPGAWAALRAVDGGAVITARALLPAGEARCGDTVRGVSWRGSHVAAVIEGASHELGLVMGDLSAGGPSRVPVEAPGTRVLAMSALHLDGAVLALWTTPGRGALNLRYRLFDERGRPLGEAAALGELLAPPSDARAAEMAAAATGPREAAMALATSHGPRMFQLRCGALR